MTSEQIAVVLALDLVLLATAAGLLRRGTWRLCLGFVVYLTVVVGFNLAIVIWPHRFFNASFWRMAHGTFEAAKLWIGLEIAYRSFHGRGGATPAARRTAVVVVGLVALVTAAVHLDESGRIFGTIGSLRWFSGSLFVILATLGIARFYGVTLHSFHTALLTSLAAYGVVFHVVLGLAFAYQWPAAPHLASLERFAFGGLACWWAYVAWRRQSHPVPPQPGRVPVTATDPDRPARPGGLMPKLAGA